MASKFPILLSSPSHQTIAITPANGLQVPMSSSPLLPSPSQLFAKKSPIVASDGRVKPGNNGAVTGFTSASKLLRQAQTGESLGDDLKKKLQELGEKANSQEQKPSKFKMPPTEISEDSLSVKNVKIIETSPTRCVSETAYSDGDLKASEESIVTQSIPKDKKHSRKSKDGTQSKIKMGRLTKPGAIRNTAGSKTGPIKAVKPLKDSNQKTAVGAPPKKVKSHDGGKKSLDLLLVEAVKRRKAWTPVKDTAKVLSPLEPIKTSQDTSIGTNQRAAEPLHNSGFDISLDNYSWAQQSNRSLLGSEQARNMAGEALSKRRKIELINSTSSTLAATPKKLKAPKKKPQTITDKATAPFIVAESPSPTLSQYFGPPTENQNKDLPADEVANLTPPTKAIKRKPRAKALNTTNLRKSTKQPPTLLSPETAMKSANNQELIFGTSSQLVRDESPTFIKDTQQAIKASEPTSRGSLMMLTPEGSSLDYLKAGTERSNISSFAASRNLWSVAARDSEGSFLNAEVIDLIDTPKPQKYPALTGLSAISGVKSSLCDIITEKDQCIPIEERSFRALDNQVELNKKDVLVIGENPLILEQPIPRSIAEASLRQRRKSRSPVKMHKTDKGSDVPSLNPALGQMPNYHGFTTAQLSKEIASYGFKAIKKRTEMIALLERCWESQSRIALQALPTNVNLPQPLADDSNVANPKQSSSSKRKITQTEAKTAKTKAIDSFNVKKASQSSTKETTLIHDEVLKKPRGRPRKQNLATPIPDTSNLLQSVPSLPATATSISPSEPRPTSVPTPPLASPTQSLHDKITHAITTFPPTHSATSPSFYERILLYEPIVLEDLTAWLNTEGLGRVGVDDEVPPGAVKEWCEKGGVCCFWKAEGWRAKR